MKNKVLTWTAFSMIVLAVVFLIRQQQPPFAVHHVRSESFQELLRELSGLHVDENMLVRVEGEMDQVLVEFTSCDETSRNKMVDQRPASRFKNRVSYPNERL